MLPIFTSLFLASACERKLATVTEMSQALIMKVARNWLHPMLPISTSLFRASACERKPATVTEMSQALIMKVA
jgi:hypothetical protein